MLFRSAGGGVRGRGQGQRREEGGPGREHVDTLVVSAVSAMQRQGRPLYMSLTGRESEIVQAGDH